MTVRVLEQIPGQEPNTSPEFVAQNPTITLPVTVAQPPTPEATIAAAVTSLGALLDPLPIAAAQLPPAQQAAAWRAARWVQRAYTALYRVQAALDKEKET